ncbi:MAG: type II toxin-antitoxin system prevent-host-death family antitoxin [Thermoleophilaceae bacterium]|nr:type II toxin-antitoxin system prevent-host-death family antitoxin [Thermoleophilaceae bacterium]
MLEVGVRQLKNELSGYLRRVRSGERVRVTLRGAPVADLVPPEEPYPGEQLDRLIAAGRVTPASAPKREPPPLTGPRDDSASALILAEREEDR